MVFRNSVVPTTRGEPCDECNVPKPQIWKCLQCDLHFCDTCWDEEKPHRPGRAGQVHEKLDTDVYSRLKKTFRFNHNHSSNLATDGQQVELHQTDTDTTWFALVKQTGKQGGCHDLQPTDRLDEIMLDSDTGLFEDRYPQLVSFVGRTGAGKSTLIKMLIGRSSPTDEPDRFPTPVSGFPGDCVPTSGDVHLYSDPDTNTGSHPILYADSEGLSGGEKSPRALEALGETQPDMERAHRPRIPLAWSKGDPDKQSRQFAVMNLVPKILYTFSDVIVFVVREIKAFESEVLQMLVEWASRSVEKSINQPGLPHVIIAINACDTFDHGLHLDTEGLLNSYRDSFSTVPTLQKIVDNLKQTGRQVSSTKELLALYYSSVEVVRIPSESLQQYMQIDRAIERLDNTIKKKCELSFLKKQHARMELNASGLVRFMSSAYDHFSQHLDKPFDFVTEALQRNPMPRGFQGHLLNFILLLYIAKSESNDTTVQDPRPIFKTLSSQVASCVMLAAARGDYKASYAEILRHNFHDGIRGAFDQFIGRWLRCGFRDSKHACYVVKNAHQKGHQNKDGKVFSFGDYVQLFDPDATFESWMESIEKHLKQLKAQLNRSGADREEPDIVWQSHLRQVANLYKALPSLGNSINYATCLCCVNKIPDHALPCGHVICDDCAKALGDDKTGDGLKFELSFCPLHTESTRPVWRPPVIIRFKPKDSGARVLCLDGGGVRGIVELAILEAMQEHLGNPESLPIRNFFDLIVGTSTGGIVGLGLGVKNWSVPVCMQKFEHVCKQAFTAKPPGLKWLGYLASTSRYKTQRLESALRSAFDEDKDRLLFGPNSDSETPFVRVAVTATLVPSNDAAILANYNGGHGSSNHEKHQYRLIREQDPSKEVKIWEAARVTSAAPPYFKPYSKRETGNSFIDGAKNHNCPIAIAHHEQEMIWGGFQPRPADILISLGTGLCSDSVPDKGTTNKAADRTPTTGFRSLWKTPRHMIDRQLDTEQAWKSYHDRITPQMGMSLLEQQRRQMRINITFPKGDARPNLDDVAKIGYLKDEAKKACKNNPDIKEAAHRLVASCFYFKTWKSRRVDTDVVVSGAIRCRFDEGSTDIKGLGRFLQSCVKVNFSPYFLLQVNYSGVDDDMRGTEIPISQARLSRISNQGIFDFPLNSIAIQSSNTGKASRLSLLLQKDPYRHYTGPDPYWGAHPPQSPPCLSISGFPRPLLQAEKFKELPPIPTHSSPIISNDNDSESDSPISDTADPIGLRGGMADGALPSSDSNSTTSDTRTGHDTGLGSTPRRPRPRLSRLFSVRQHANLNDPSSSSIPHMSSDTTRHSRPALSSSRRQTSSTKSAGSRSEIFSPGAESTTSASTTHTNTTSDTHQRSSISVSTEGASDLCISENSEAGSYFLPEVGSSARTSLTTSFKLGLGCQEDGEDGDDFEEGYVDPVQSLEAHLNQALGF